MKNTTLHFACIQLGWQGGTIHQVKAEIRKMTPYNRTMFIIKLKRNSSQISDQHILTELSAITTEHLQFTKI